jgi:hypothetical protein
LNASRMKASSAGLMVEIIGISSLPGYTLRSGVLGSLSIYSGES